MKVSYKGRRAKGKAYERWIASEYRRTGLDPTAQPMPMSGAMEFHKGDILKKQDNSFVDECKNQETTKLWEWWDQAKSQARGLQTPVLHLKRNRSESLSVISTDVYFQMRLELKQLREQFNIGE